LKSKLPTFDKDEEDNIILFNLWCTRVEGRGLHPEVLFTHHHNVHHHGHDGKDIEQQPQHSSSTLADKLHHICKINARSVEVVEQILLTVHYVAKESYICKLALVECGMDRLIETLKVSRECHPYILALCTLCEEILAPEAS